MLESRTLINQCYILRERLCEDSFCEHWRASAIFTASDFLIRFLKPEFQARTEAVETFVAAARGPYRFTAPAVEDIVEVDSFGGRLFIVTEWDGGIGLDRTMAGGKHFDVDQAGRLALELGKELAAFHHRGLCYGPLTPETVVTHSEDGAIADIFIRKPGYAAFMESLAEPAAVRANWGYASPEAKRGESVDVRSDVYTLGAVLYKLLTGRLPYGNRSDADPRRRSAAPQPVVAALARRAVPPELAVIVVRALRLKPAGRFQTIAELNRTLWDFLESRAAAAREAGRPDQLAGMAGLNLRKIKTATAEATRRLDTVEYFRSLASAGEAPAATGKPSPLAAHGTAAWEAIAALDDQDELKAESFDDDDRISAENYVRSGYAGEKPTQAAREAAVVPAAVPWPPAVGPEAEQAEPAGLAGQTPPPAEAAPAGKKRPTPPPASGLSSAAEPAAAPPPAASGPTTPRPNAAPALPEKPEPAPSGSRPPASRREPSAAIAVPKGRDAASGDPAAELIVAGNAPAVPAAGLSASSPRRAGGAVAGPPLTWRRSGGSPEFVAASLRSAFRGAEHSRGSFKFIEDPGLGRPARLIAAAIEELRPRAFVVDLERLKPGTDLTGLIDAVRLGLAIAANRDGRRDRRLYADRLRANDPEGSLGAAPLGRVLYGYDEPDPPAPADEAATIAATARAVAGFGRRTRPLVLIARGAENVGESAHRWLVELAAATRNKPVCAFLFFAPAGAADWHVLSRLRGQSS